MATTATDQWVGFVDFLDPPRPGVLPAAREVIVGIGVLRRLRRCKGALSRAGAADVESLAVVLDRLLAGIRDMSATGGGASYLCGRSCRASASGHSDRPARNILIHDQDGQEPVISRYALAIAPVA